MRAFTTISEAVDDLQKRGYAIDFNVGYSGIRSHETPFSLATDKFRITEVYRFEGDTDPADEAVVYAIESPAGYKGILVNGYGISSDPANDEIIKELAIEY
ncbi:MAG TPA: hypothetical protein VFW11_11035 [Cyclobacteriaceae bacterium]|nr:hypothetical protein [Cyclobacteriaceae bacterium]